MNPPERRLFESVLSIRDTQAVGRPYKYLEGRAVPWDVWTNVGFFMESHAPGSFKHSTRGGAGKSLPLLLFHDNRSWPIGHAESWGHDDGGLDGVWKLTDSAEAQRAARMADDGDLTGLSIGFQPIRSDWAAVDDWDPELGPDHMDRVTRMESRLLEVSVTPTPAFADAQVALVRSAERMRERPDRDADVWRREVDRLRVR